MTQHKQSHRIKWHDHHIKWHDMHQNRSHHHHGTAEGSFTAKKWFGHRAGRSPCAHSIGKFFLCYIVLFSSETSAPGSPGNYLYIMTLYVSDRTFKSTPWQRKKLLQTVGKHLGKNWIPMQLRFGKPRSWGMLWDIVHILRFCCLTHLIQWIIPVLVLGGRDYITPSKAIYNWYLSGICSQLGDYILPATFYNNPKNLLTDWRHGYTSSGSTTYQNLRHPEQGAPLPYGQWVSLGWQNPTYIGIKKTIYNS